MLSKNITAALGKQCEFMPEDEKARRERAEQEAPVEPLDRDLANSVEAAEAKLHGLSQQVLQFRAAVRSGSHACVCPRPSSFHIRATKVERPHPCYNLATYVQRLHLLTHTPHPCFQQH